MPKLPQVAGKNVVKALIKDGWIKVGQEGSHVKLIKRLQAVGKATIIIPQHKVIKKGTLNEIIKKTGITVEKLK